MPGPDLQRRRDEAIAERSERLAAFIARREELLRQAYSLSRDASNAVSYGSGHREAENQGDDEAVAFVKRFAIDGDATSNALPASLPVLPPTPPDSPASATSEAIAADLVPQSPPKSARPAIIEAESLPAVVPDVEDSESEDEEPPPAEPAKPFEPPTASTEASTTPQVLVQPPISPKKLPTTVDPAFLLQQSRDYIPESAKHARTTHIEMLDSYADDLPPLPDDVLRNRLLVGGLYRKKQKEKDRSTGSSVGLAGGADLFRLGISKAQNMSVRNWMGVGIEGRAHPPARTGKVLLTEDWNVGFQELKLLRAMERIEQAKADGNWSLRQIKKQKGPVIPKSHQDYMLDEMRWMRTDFREERKWKIATAVMLASCVLEWHEASAQERAELCIKVRPPRFLPANGETAEMEVDNEASPSKPAVHVNSDSNGIHEPEMQEADVSMNGDQSAFAQLPFAPSSAERPPPSPISQQELYPLRAPLFQQPHTTTVISIDEMPLAEVLVGTREATSRQLLSLLTADLPLYDGLAEPPEGRVDRRYDESTPHHSRITPATHITQSKPLLLSTLEPARKRRKLDRWTDMSHLVERERSELETKAENLPIGSTLFAGRKPKEVSHAVVVTAPQWPKDVDLEARAAALDWTEQDDQTILKMSKEYAYNWKLIAEIFNSSTFRVSTDKRLEWDIYDRWNRKFGPASNQTATVSGPSSDAATGSAQKPPIKIKKVIGKYDGPKRKLHQNALHDAIRRLQKNREKTARPPWGSAHAPRKVNLNAHETHNVTTRPNMTPLEMSMFKAEVDRERAVRQAAILQQQRQVQQAALAARYPQMAQQQQQQAAQAAAAQQAARGGPPARPPSAAGSAGPNASPRAPVAPIAASPAGASTQSPRPSLANLPLEQQHQLLVDHAQKLRAAGQGDSEQGRMIAERLRLVQGQLMVQAQQIQQNQAAASQGAEAGEAGQ